jgi:hypothetical protein
MAGSSERSRIARKPSPDALAATLYRLVAYWLRCGGNSQQVSVMSSAQLYDTIGATYTVTRRTEPRIAAQISAALGDARTYLMSGPELARMNPSDRDFTTVEPSAVKRAQRLLSLGAPLSLLGASGFPPRLPSVGARRSPVEGCPVLRGAISSPVSWPTA